MVSAFCAALCVAVAALAILGDGQRGTSVALELTGRLSFLLFLPAYAGGALAALFGPIFLVLKRYGREFGLAFASAHLVHIGLVGWLSYIGAAPPASAFIFFGIAAFWTYLLALFSIGGLQQSLGKSGWWLLRTVALNYILVAFAADFLRAHVSGDIKYLIGYVPFAVLSVVAPAVRLTAFLRRLVYLRRASSSKADVRLPG